LDYTAVSPVVGGDGVSGIDGMRWFVELLGALDLLIAQTVA
jgi:hypothetical protein